MMFIRSTVAMAFASVAAAADCNLQDGVHELTCPQLYQLGVVGLHWTAESLAADEVFKNQAKDKSCKGKDNSCHTCLATKAIARMKTTACQCKKVSADSKLVDVFDTTNFKSGKATDAECRTITKDCNTKPTDVLTCGGFKKFAAVCTHNSLPVDSNLNTDGAAQKAATTKSCEQCIAQEKKVADCWKTTTNGAPEAATGLALLATATAFAMN